MTVRREQLEIQLDRLEATFGDKPFSEQRALMIWDAVRHLDYPSVCVIVDSFIRSSKFAPLPEEFFKAAREFQPQSREYALGEAKPRGLARCNDCADSGFAPVIRLDTFEDWAKSASGQAPCHCDRGRELIEVGKRMRRPVEFGPQWGELWRTSYRISPMYGEGA